MAVVHSRGLSRAFALAAIMAVGTSPVQAADWIAPTGGSWQSAANWSPTGVPASSDAAAFNLSSTYTVSLSADTAISGITNTSDALTLDLGTYTLTDAGVLTIFGPTAAHVPTMTVLHGTLNASGVSTGGSSGAGSLTVGRGGTLIDRSGYQLSVGVNSGAGTGSFNITDGGNVGTVGGLYVGYNGVGQAVISGTGSSFRTVGAGRLYVGEGGSANGTLTVSDGGTLTTTYTNTQSDIGYSGGVGTLAVQDGGSSWTHTGNVYVGGTSLDRADQAGTGTLSVANGAAVNISETLTVRQGGGTLRVAGGTVNVGGTATLSGTTQLQLTSLNSNGTKVIAGNDVLNTTLAVSLASGVNPAAGQRFDLFDGAISGTYAFDFSQAPLASGLTWDTSDFAADGVVAVESAPEPGTVALGLLAAYPLVGTRRRRRR